MLPVGKPHPNLWERDGSWLLAVPSSQPIAHPLSTLPICICTNRAMSMVLLHEEPLRKSPRYTSFYPLFSSNYLFQLMLGNFCHTLLTCDNIQTVDFSPLLSNIA